MHDILRERLWRQLEALPEDRLYQVLDYIEFLTSKYARDQVRSAGSPIQRFGERLEDKLRGNGVGFGAIRGTLEVMGTADRVMSGLRDVGRSILNEVGGTEPERNPPPPARPVLKPGTASEDVPVDG